ncbi:hypothetical protein SKAU_G00268850 [Synaphobranchus kaupii]|uniref:Hypoxia-inducible factor 1-alpha n=1 Tax=Synaphobranchus kaupii TaxID=118154 RepID=A0A9Q1F062_SYNKA|nr:hypothetical protein SKAU_G00268850 [Synaphobranchus kaupii]
MLRPKLLKHRENTEYRQSRYEAAGEQWEQERPGKEMETDNQFGGAEDEREREQGGAEWQKSKGEPDYGETNTRQGERENTGNNRTGLRTSQIRHRLSLRTAGRANHRKPFSINHLDLTTFGDGKSPKPSGLPPTIHLHASCKLLYTSEGRAYGHSFWKLSSGPFPPCQQHMGQEVERMPWMREGMSGVKKRRVCSEWRKAHSRVAARSRREQECGLFGELLRGLPLPSTVVAHLDKTSVIRLTHSCLRLRTLLDVPDCAFNTPDCTLEGTHPVTLQNSTAAQGCESVGTSSVEMLLDSALEGFLLLLSRDGRVIYTTEAISMHTGIKQVDLIGQSLYDFMHPCDQQEAREILSSKSGAEESQKCDISFRMRCTVTSQKGKVNLKSATWKVMHCTGVRKPCEPAGSDCLVLLCQSLPAPVSGTWDSCLNCSVFQSRHSPNMRFTFCQPRVFQLTGYTETDLLGHSVYQYYHASDCQHVHKALLSLFSKGQTSTGKYRLLVKQGGYVWVETVATVVYSRTGQLLSVICINYILSEVEQSGVMFSLEQMEHLLKPFCSSPAPDTPLLLQGATLLDKLNQQAAVPADPSDHATPGESPWTRGYEGHLNGVAEEDAFTTCHELETLAPYIPMDGEDFLLSPISDMEGVGFKGQGPLYASTLTFPNLDILSPTSPLSLLSHPWTPLIPPMSSETPPGYYSPPSSNQDLTVMTEHGGDSGRGCRQRSGRVRKKALQRCRTNTHLPPGPHSQGRKYCPSGLQQHTAHPWKKPKEADSSYSTNCTSCWYTPDGSLGCYGSVPWAPGHTDFSLNTRNQDLSLRDPHRTVLVSCASVLPVLSRRECEVNAPLEPFLLPAPWIRDPVPSWTRATSRLPPMRAHSTNILPPCSQKWKFRGHKEWIHYSTESSEVRIYSYRQAGKGGASQKDVSVETAEAIRQLLQQSTKGSLQANANNYTLCLKSFSISSQPKTGKPTRQNLSLSQTKCHLFRKQMTFLGHAQQLPNLHQKKELSQLWEGACHVLEHLLDVVYWVCLQIQARCSIKTTWRCTSRTRTRLVKFEK